MTHKLVLEVPEEVFQPLVQTAQRSGESPEQLAVAWLTVASRHAAADPLEPFIGTVRGNPSDWADQHDKYLGRNLSEQSGSAEESKG